MVTEEETGISEEEYQKELAQGGRKLSEEAAKIDSKMRTSKGVEFAPWMKIDPELALRAEKEREERNRKRAAAARELQRIDLDPQAAELGGGGLRSKVISEEEVELRWSTDDEAGNAGFIVQRRPGGSQAFEVIASYEKEAVLKSKGPSGGTYTFIDDEVPSVGTWVYRVLDCDNSGNKSALCQKLVEVDSKSEQMTTLILGGVLLAIAAALVAAGLYEDPIQTTALGRGF